MSLESNTSITRILTNLEEVKELGETQWTALCPAHKDSEPSLSIGLGDDGRVLLNCHAGCDTQDVVDALDMTMAHLFPGSEDEPIESFSDSPLTLGESKPKLAVQRPESKTTKNPIESSTGPLSLAERGKLAKQLGVCDASIEALKVGWCESSRAWTFPEVDGAGETVGICKRSTGGARRFKAEGKRGLYVPEGQDTMEGPVLVPEGASDTMALHGMGLCAIGRPAATIGEEASQWLARIIGDREVIVLGEMDANRSGKWPGRDGAVGTAQSLSRLLGRPVAWALPPDGAKDARDWLQKHLQVSNDEKDFRKLGQRFLGDVLTSTTTVEPVIRVYRPEFIDSAEFTKAVYEKNWLVEQVLVEKQPAVLGGPKKTLKTSILVDLAVSLGCNELGLFLNRFHTNGRHRVGFISGESGAAVVQDTAKRICKAKGISLKNTNVRWSFKLPKLAVEVQLRDLEHEIDGEGIEVVIIDPLYLCLLAGDQSGRNANVLYDMGPLLADAAEACLAAGATPILAHHSRKNLNEWWQPLELEDLAFSGISEFARQWILISRQKKFDP